MRSGSYCCDAVVDFDQDPDSRRQSCFRIGTGSGLGYPSSAIGSYAGSVFRYSLPLPSLPPHHHHFLLFISLCHAHLRTGLVGETPVKFNQPSKLLDEKKAGVDPNC